MSIKLIEITTIGGKHHHLDLKYHNLEGLSDDEIIIDLMLRRVFRLAATKDLILLMNRDVSMIYIERE